MKTVGRTRRKRTDGGDFCRARHTGSACTVLLLVSLAPFVTCNPRDDAFIGYSEKQGTHQLPRQAHLSHSSVILQRELSTRPCRKQSRVTDRSWAGKVGSIGYGALGEFISSLMELLTSWALRADSHIADAKECPRNYKDGPHTCGKGYHLQRMQIL